MQWLHEVLHGRAAQRADVAMDAADDVIIKSRSLRKQLEPFQREKDPFAAITAWHEISATLNERELKGPFH